MEQPQYTVQCNLKKRKDKLLKFCAESDEQKLMENRKTLHRAKNEDLDCACMEWIHQCRSEHLTMLIMKQAKIYHDKLNIEADCEYTFTYNQIQCFVLYKYPYVL